MADTAAHYPPRPQTPADELRFARMYARVTKVELATHLGKDPQTISRWESNDHPSEPTISQWREIARFLNAPWLNHADGADFPLYGDIPFEVHEGQLVARQDPLPGIIPGGPELRIA